jgi:flagellar motor protein MotB
MSRVAAMPWLWACIALGLGGCADNAMVVKGRLGDLERQQTAMSRQNQQLQDRVNALSRDNEEKDVLLAQSRQQTKVSDDRVALMQEQLRTTTSQLTQIRAEKDGTDKRVQMLTASMQRQGGVTISPNNSFLQTLPAANVPGVVSRRDGDVIRVELPGHVLFENGTAQLRPGATELITNTAADIGRLYPDQIIGVEGHTDSDPVVGGQYRNNQALSTARAMVVYDVLTTRTRLQQDQLFVMGRGSINPIVSNGTVEGKQRNRRVELVVYPDRRPPAPIGRPSTAVSYPGM